MEPDVEGIIVELEKKDIAGAMVDVAKFLKDLPAGIHECVLLAGSEDIKRLVYWFT